MECSTGPGQGVCGEEAQKDHEQYGCMPFQGEGNHTGYHHQEIRFPYQTVIISNNQVEVSFK